MSNIQGAVEDEFFLAHIIGWWGKVSVRPVRRTNRRGGEWRAVTHDRFRGWMALNPRARPGSVCKHFLDRCIVKYAFATRELLEP